MERLKQEYKKTIQSLCKNRIFILVILLVTILSFGFTITNSSVGVDDTAFDRYYEGQEMLAIGRWGAYVVYHILDLVQFTPFWPDLIASLLVASIAMLWCIFLKKNLKEKLSNGACYVLAGMFISYPIINEIFIYQNCNIAVILGNLLASLGMMLLYENRQQIHKKSIYGISILILTLGISMYEACFQFMLLSICALGIVLFYQTEEKQTKKVLQYVAISVMIVIIAVILNSVIVKSIYLCGIPVSEAAEKEIHWGKYSISDSVKMIEKNIHDATIDHTKYFPVKVFLTAVVLGCFISIIQAYQKRNVLIVLLYMGMVISNFAISILQLEGVMYRTCNSWGLFVALIFMVFYMYMSKYKATKIMAGIVLMVLVLQQSRNLTQMFYNDYIRYQRDLSISYELINKLETNCDISKPLVIAGWPKKSIGKDGAQVNSLSVLWWGKKAWSHGEEFIKFLNSLGYQFQTPNDEQYQKGMREAENMNHYPKEESIKELEDCIVINF